MAKESNNKHVSGWYAAKMHPYQENNMRNATAICRKDFSIFKRGVEYKAYISDSYIAIWDHNFYSGYSWNIRGRNSEGNKEELKESFLLL